MAAIRHQVLIDAPAAKVYQAISTPEAVGTWWDKQTPTQTDRGMVLEHNPGPEHEVVKLRVVEQVPNKRMEWECISTHRLGGGTTKPKTGGGIAAQLNHSRPFPPAGELE